MTEILHSFMRSDWQRFKAFWLRGIWKHLPFVVVSKRRLENMYWDISDHAVYYTVKHPNTAILVKAYLRPAGPSEEGE